MKLVKYSYIKQKLLLSNQLNLSLFIPQGLTQKCHTLYLLYTCMLSAFQQGVLVLTWLTDIVPEGEQGLYRELEGSYS